MITFIVLVSIGFYFYLPILFGISAAFIITAIINFIYLLGYKEGAKSVIKDL